MNRMNIKVIVGLCAALASGPVRAAGSPFVGRWHWNRAQSKVPPGGPVPDDLTSEISRADNLLKWSVTVVTPDGQHAETFEAPTNGDSHPISTDTTASCRVAGDAVQTTFKGPAGESDVQTCTLSADQKRMTCSGVLTARDGETIKYVDVYDRM